MVTGGPGRTGSRWVRIRRQFMDWAEQNQVPCMFCHRPIDYEFTKLNPYHRMAGTANHIIPLARGGDPRDLANLAPAHRHCNCRDGRSEERL